jgi:hypothetical protein
MITGIHPMAINPNVKSITTDIITILLSLPAIPDLYIIYMTNNSMNTANIIFAKDRFIENAEDVITKNASIVDLACPDII